GVAELDSDMADITQSVLPESMLGAEDGDGELPPADVDTMKLGGVVFPDHELTGSSHIPSSLGINPHTLQIMKASLFTEDEEDGDMFQNHRTVKVSTDVSSPRLVLPGAPGRPSGMKLFARFTSGPFPQYSDPPGPARPVSRGSPAVADPARPLQWKSPGPASFLLPPHIPEPAIRKVGVRRLGGPGGLLMDTGLFATRSFRVGWGPGWTLAHCGSRISSQTSKQLEYQELGTKTDFSFLPKPSRSKPLTESPYRVVLEHLVGLEPPQGMTSEEEDSHAMLQRPLEICLKHSAVGVPEGVSCPLVEPQTGVAALHEYAEWITELNDRQGDLEPILGHWAEVWTLCEALWGQLGPSDQEPGTDPLSEYEQQLQRRRAFSAWLSHGASCRVEKEVALVGKGRHTEAIFSYLTSSRISEACRLAQKEGDHRLSLLLSQAAGSRFCRDLLALQLADWNQMQTDHYLTEERLRIFVLLAGKSVWQSSESVVNVCSELDWKRCVAVHLWYMLPPTASVADALAKYEAAFQVSSSPQSAAFSSGSELSTQHSALILQGSTEAGRYACAPLPPYREEELPEEGEESMQPLYDLCFHLLKLYSDRDSSTPATPPSWRAPASGTWPSSSCCTSPTTSKARTTRPVYLLEEDVDPPPLCLPSQRERAVREMLTLHCPLQETDESVRRERFLTERLLIPERWIHEAKATRAHRDGDRHQQAMHLYRAGYWNQCHRLLIQHLASGMHSRQQFKLIISPALLEI
ncbi:hypothetical protein GOODEAATRI_026750, partial [Goodea atripinnis]